MTDSLRPQDHWIATPGGRLFARRWPGANAVAAPIVLFHDSLGCVELWRDFPERLAAATGRTVIAYDRLGFGRSDAHPGLLSTRFIGEEAAQFFPLLCEQLGIDDFIAFGHSVGGAMAAHCAALFPQRCQALVTESAQAFVEQRTRDGIAQARNEFAKPGQLDRLVRYHGDKAAWVLAAWAETWLSDAFAPWTLAAGLPQLECPLLVLHGSEDEYGSSRHPQLIAELAADAEMLILPELHHVPHREQPETVLAAVARFLAARG